MRNLDKKLKNAMVSLRIGIGVGLGEYDVAGEVIERQGLRAVEDAWYFAAQVERITELAVVQARAEGATWEQIGEKLNMTRQAAWERWRRAGEV